MVTAYVMVKSNTAAADRVKDDLLALDGVVDAHIVAGDVDFVVKLSVDSPAAVKGVVADEVQTLDGVEDTQTYVSMG
ncbi:MAG: Lrp/AsnC family transcriptional regulator [Halolamina sp.]